MKQFVVVASADACNRPTFIAQNGNGIAEVLDLGDHAGRVELRVWDVAGRLVYRDMDYRNDWETAGLAHGMYIYQVAVKGECPSSFTGKILALR